MAYIAQSAHAPAVEHHRGEDIGRALEEQLRMLQVQLLAEGAR